LILSQTSDNSALKNLRQLVLIRSYFMSV